MINRMLNKIGRAGSLAVNKVIRLRTSALLIAFSLADLFAGLLNELLVKGVLTSRFFRLARDRGFAELIQYGKFALIILMLVRWNRVRGSKLITAWVILFAILLADDSIGLHEAIGGLLMGIADFISFEGVRTKDIAEAVSFAMLEGCACLYVLFRYFQAPRDLRAYSRGLAYALVPLIVGGLVLDVLPFHDLEQPCEMLAMTILLGFVHWKYRIGLEDDFSNKADSRDGS